MHVLNATNMYMEHMRTHWEEGKAKREEKSKHKTQQGENSRFVFAIYIYVCVYICIQHTFRHTGNFETPYIIMRKWWWWLWWWCWGLELLKEILKLSFFIWKKWKCMKLCISQFSVLFLHMYVPIFLRIDTIFEFFPMSTTWK